MLVSFRSFLQTIREREFDKISSYAHIPLTFEVKDKCEPLVLKWDDNPAVILFVTLEAPEKNYSNCSRQMNVKKVKMSTSSTPEASSVTQ